jgi:hypothetical protein
MDMDNGVQVLILFGTGEFGYMRTDDRHRGIRWRCCLLVFQT